MRRMIYFPDRSRPAPPPGVDEITLTTADGLALTAWSVGDGERTGSVGKASTAVLVAPGNGGNRAGRVDLARALAREGLAVLLLEYRGYGGNPGAPSEKGLALDARAAWEHLAARHGRVVLLGESLGCAVVTRLATQVAPHGMVLRSPFTSLVDAGRAHYPFLPVGLLLRDRFPVRTTVGTVTAPTIVVYGTRDSVVPAAQSRAVAEAAANLVEAVAVEGADHNDEMPAVVEAVRRLAYT